MPLLIDKQVYRYFPNIVPQDKIKITLPILLNLFWVSDFVAGDGSFVLGLRKNKIKKSKRFGIYFNFTIT